MPFSRPRRIMAFLIFAAISQPVRGADPASTPPTPMSQEDVANFLTPLKRGTPVQLFLGKGKIVKGLYKSYDDYYETVWIIPQGERGVFNEKGFKLSGIKRVELWDRKMVKTSTASIVLPADVSDDDYYLLKQSDYKQ